MNGRKKLTKVLALTAVITVVAAMAGDREANRVWAHGQVHATKPNPIRTWNELALDTVRIKRLSDAQAACNLH
jgi:hypothetical protein